MARPDEMRDIHHFLRLYDDSAAASLAFGEAPDAIYRHGDKTVALEHRTVYPPNSGKDLAHESIKHKSMTLAFESYRYVYAGRPTDVVIGFTDVSRLHRSEAAVAHELVCLLTGGLFEPW